MHRGHPSEQEFCDASKYHPAVSVRVQYCGSVASSGRAPEATKERHTKTNGLNLTPRVGGTTRRVYEEEGG